MNKKGISVIYSALLVLLVISIIYTYMNAIVVPNICENKESQFIDTLISKSLDFVATSWDVIQKSTPTAYYFPLGGHYPIIPFFVTPDTYTATLITYKAEFSLNNIEYKDIDVGQHNPSNNIELKDICNIKIVSNTGLIRNYNIYIEYGIVALCHGDECYLLKGKILDDNGNIYLQFYKSYETFSVSSVNGILMRLCPYSAGKANLRLYIKNGRIILKTDLPKSFWDENIYNVFSGEFVKSWSFDTHQKTLTVFLKDGNYTLHAGIVAIGGDLGREPPEYLVRISPPAGKSPAEVYVMAKDSLGNPVPNAEIVFTPTDTTICDNLNCYTSSKTYHTNSDGVAGVIAKTDESYGTVTAKVIRPSGGPYEVYFVIYGS